MVEWNKLKFYGKYKTEDEAKTIVSGLKKKGNVAKYTYEPHNIDKWLVWTYVK